MNKRRLHHEYKRLKKVKAIYLLAAALFFLILGVYGLRQNYSHMAELRTAVTTADEQNGDVEAALRNLREFVYGHMNTDLSSGNVSIKPPIQLKYRYERLAKQEEKRVEKKNQAVKEKAEKACLNQYPGKIFNSNRVNCVARYIAANSTKADPVPSDLYKFDFVSPGWSPDLAGISLLLSFIFFLLLAIRKLAEAWYRYELS